MFKNFKDISEAVSDADLNTMTIKYRDGEGTLEALIKFIQENGNTGHSFSIVVDPGDENEKRFGWDGDGMDYIKDIIVTKNN